MFDNLFKKEPRLTTSEKIDEIQKSVYENLLKESGFKKNGRTFNKIVDKDIVQVINFQTGAYTSICVGYFWMNIGIRIPESFERVFEVLNITKKYYKEYECNIRMRLSGMSCSNGKPYDLSKNINNISNDITLNIKKHVLPMFNDLDSRDKIIQNRYKYNNVEMGKHLELLDTAMIYGRIGNKREADKLFNKYYLEVVNSINC